jgi:hypothetical protein
VYSAEKKYIALTWQSPDVMLVKCEPPDKTASEYHPELLSRDKYRSGIVVSLIFLFPLGPKLSRKIL